MRRKVRSPKAARHRKIPYRLYGKAVRASRQASGCGEGICGAVPFPAKLPADSQV